MSPLSMTYEVQAATRHTRRKGDERKERKKKAQTTIIRANGIGADQNNYFFAFSF